jgi:hypothetical protein
MKTDFLWDWFDFGFMFRIFKNTKFHRQKPAIVCVLTDFVRVTTLPSTALQHR